MNKESMIAKEERKRPLVYSLIVVINSYREHLLGPVLANNKLVESLADFLRSRKIPTQIGPSDPPVPGPRGPNEINTNRSLRSSVVIVRPILWWLPIAAATTTTVEPQTGPEKPTIGGSESVEVSVGRRKNSGD